jgi:hypothetical protein
MDEHQPWDGRVVRSKTTGARVLVQDGPCFGVFSGICVGSKDMPILPANMQYYWPYWMANNFEIDERQIRSAGS